MGRALGRLSFGAYLHHHFVVLIVTWAAIELGLIIGLNRPGQTLSVAGGLPELLGIAAVVFPVTIGLAWLTERAIERPLYRWARASVRMHPGATQVQRGPAGPDQAAVHDQPPPQCRVGRD